MDLHFAITAIATAFTIIDPVGMVPLSLSVMAGAPPDVRRRTIDKAVIVATCVVIFMGLVGRAVLGYLGITLPAFSIAGGVLLLLISIDMLFARPSGTRKTDEEEQEAILNENVAVFPLAIPMLAGPGTIATVLLLVSLAHNDPVRVPPVRLVRARVFHRVADDARSGRHLICGKMGIHVVSVFSDHPLRTSFNSITVSRSTARPPRLARRTP
jgi:multiple antibiotic resistance protein